MIVGAHILLYSKDPEADRAFFRDVLQFRAVDIGRGWLIFKLPPAEAAVHPSSGEFAQRHSGHDLMGSLMYLMCDDLAATDCVAARTGRRLFGGHRRAVGDQNDDPPAERVRNRAVPADASHGARARLKRSRYTESQTPLN